MSVPSIESGFSLAVKGPKYLSPHTARLLLLDLHCLGLNLWKLYELPGKPRYIYRGGVGVSYLPIELGHLGWAGVSVHVDRFDMLSHEKFSDKLWEDSGYSMNRVRELEKAYTSSDNPSLGDTLLIRYAKGSRTLSQDRAYFGVYCRDLNLLPRVLEDVLISWNGQ